MSHAHHAHGGHAHGGHAADENALKAALAMIVAFMAVEVVAGVIASSLALLSDAAHMLTDAAALALALLAARLASRPAAGAMTYGLGRAEILSAQANGVTLLVLALLIVYDGIRHLISPPAVEGSVVLVVALAGIAVNLLAVRILAANHDAEPRSLNIEGSYRHILTDLFGFIATAIAAGVILATGFRRADPIASLVIAGLMLHAAYGLLRASARVFMEAAPDGLDVWEVTSGFPALSAHVVARAGDDCHELRRRLQMMLGEHFQIDHTTLQVDHEVASQPPLQIEIAPREQAELDSRG